MWGGGEVFSSLPIRSFSDWLTLHCQLCRLLHPSPLPLGWGRMAREGYSERVSFPAIGEALIECQQVRLSWEQALLRTEFSGVFQDGCFPLLEARKASSLILTVSLPALSLQRFAGYI